MKICITIEADDAHDLRRSIAAIAPLGLDPRVGYDAIAKKLADFKTANEAKSATVAAVEATVSAEEIATDTAVEFWPRAARVADEPEAELPAHSVAEPPKRERGKPDPASGRSRRTKAEIEEDERAEAAETGGDGENDLGGPSDVRYYVNESTDDLERVAPGDASPKGKFWTQVSKRTFEGHRAMVDARKGSVASKFAEEVEAEVEPPKSMLRVDSNDTYWFDSKKEEYFMVAAGEDLPPDTDRYEEVTRRVYERAQKDAAPASKAEPAKGAKLTLDDVLGKMDELMNAVPTDQKGDAAMSANAVYTSFGAKKLKELKPEHFAEAIKKLDDLIAEAKKAKKGRG